MEELLTLEDVARKLKVSTQTVRRMVKGKELRAIKIRGQYRIYLQDLEAYIRNKSR